MKRILSKSYKKNHNIKETKKYNMNRELRYDEEYDETVDTYEYEQETNATSKTSIHSLVNIEQKEKPLEYVKGMVRTWCYEGLWSHLKFISIKNMEKLNLRINNSVFESLFTRISIANNNIEEKEVFLKTYAETIIKTINEYRSNTQDMYKRDVLKCK